jgi:hypothetical protein
VPLKTYSKPISKGSKMIDPNLYKMGKQPTQQSSFKSKKAFKEKKKQTKSLFKNKEQKRNLKNEKQIIQ